MKLIQLFDIKTRTLGFAFCQPPKKSLPKSLTQKKSLQNFKPKKSPQIANFKPKKGLRTSPSLIYLSTPLGLSPSACSYIVASCLRERSISHIERFSIECRKTKTKVITMANQNKGKYHKEPMRTQSKRM